MTHVEARRWIKRLPEGRGHALDAGAKAVLQELWDHVTWTIERNVTGRECWPSRRRIAEEIGTTAETVKKRLDRLAAAGWIRRDGDGWALAWATPFPDSGTALPGEPVPRPRGTGAPPPGNRCPAPGEPMPRNQGIEPSHERSEEPSQVAGAPAPSELVQDPPPQDTATPSADDRTDPQPAVTAETADSSPPAAAQREDPPPPSPAPAKPRRRKAAPPKPGQTALGLADGPPPDEVAELLELHERLRADALRAHGEAVTGWPGPSSKYGQALRRGLRQALAQRGATWCRAMLAWRALEWQRDATQLAWSGHNVWSSKSIAHAIERMGRAASRSRHAGLLSAPPPSYDSAVHDYVPPDCGEEMKGF